MVGNPASGESLHQLSCVQCGVGIEVRLVFPERAPIQAWPSAEPCRRGGWWNRELRNGWRSSCPRYCLDSATTTRAHRDLGSRGPLMGAAGRNLWTSVFAYGFVDRSVSSLSAWAGMTEPTYSHSLACSDRMLDTRPTQPVPNC